MAHNYFASAQVAELYPRARPTPHRDIVRYIAERLGNAHFYCALDVGCGTGNSSIALTDVADSIIAVDTSREMLAHAISHPRIRYVLARAERLPFADATFDIVSIGQALHWFEQPIFFAECRRVLTHGNVVAAYNDHFTSVLRGMPEFQRWFRRVYSKRFRRRRGMRDIDVSAAASAGFTTIERAGFERSEWFTREQMSEFLLTHSNTSSARDGAREWLDAELLALIPDDLPREFVFKTNLYLLRA